MKFLLYLLLLLTINVSSGDLTSVCTNRYNIFDEGDGVRALNLERIDSNMSQVSRQIEVIRSQKHFIAVLLHNSQHLFDDWYREFILFVELIGDSNYSNIFVSIHDSGSVDNTAQLLLGLKDRLVNLGVIMVDIETSLELDPYQLSDGYQKLNRIEKLSYLRNRALRSLLKSDVKYDNVVYVNDVFFCATDLLTLVISSTSNDADVTCSVDIVKKKNVMKKSIFFTIYGSPRI